MIERAKTMIEKAKQTWYWTVGSIGAVLVTTVIVMWLMGAFESPAVQ
jgi:uncharacterized membrane protein YdcZ (DUF606 family)